MNLRHLIRFPLPARRFCSSLGSGPSLSTDLPPSEKMFPQMILKLDSHSLITYFQTDRTAFSPESWIYTLERALMMVTHVNPIFQDLLTEIGGKLGYFDPLFISYVLDLLSNKGLRMPDFVEPLLESRPDFFDVVFKDETYVWLMEHVKSSANLRTVQQRFFKRFRLYNPPNDEKIFLSEEDGKKTFVERFSLIIRLLRIFTVKKHSLKMIDLLEFRMLSEIQNLNLENILELLTILSKNSSRTPNQYLIDAISARLAKFVGKIGFKDAFKLVKHCSNLNFTDNHVLVDLGKTFENHISQKEMWTVVDLENMAQAVFAFSKIEALTDSLFQAFQNLFFQNFASLNGKTISLFCFAHVKIIEKKYLFFKSTWSNLQAGKLFNINM